MNNSLSKFYRKEPISSFLFLLGITDAAIGGLGGRWSLFSLGLLTIVIATSTRWLQIRQASQSLPEQPPRYYLPSSSSRPPLPVLTKEKNRPSDR
jgi:hypothetical protein